MSPALIANLEPNRKSFQPYKSATLDTPLVHLIVEPLLPLLRPVLKCIFSIRWQLCRPLQVRVIPNFVPLIELPLFQDLTYLTYGQLLLALPLLVFAISGYYFTFVVPDVLHSGEYASYAIYCTFLTANKTNSIFSFLLGIPFERMIPFHNASALITVILAGFHGYVGYVYGGGGGNANANGGGRHLVVVTDVTNNSQYGLLGNTPNLGLYLLDGTTNMSGTLLFASISVLVLTSVFPWLRRQFFNFWLWIHLLAIVCVFIFATIHQVSSILFLATWWIVDLFTRYVVMAACRYPHTAKLELIQNDIVRISFPKTAGFSYNGGQFVQIAVKEIGLMEFHPASISSAPHENEVTLHIRALGDWTKRLANLARQQKEAVILLEGPYGSLSMDADDENRYKMALIVAGGIGVTHCNSVAKTLIQNAKCGRRLKHLRFVWAVRDLDMLDVMDPLEAPEDGADWGASSRDFRTASMHLEAPSAARFSESMEMGAGSKKPMVQTDIYLTKSSPSTPIALSDGRNIYFGRPDLERTVAELRAQAMKRNVTHVAVFGCGPKALIDDLKDVCRRYTQGVAETSGVTFDVHEEIFDF